MRAQLSVERIKGRLHGLHEQPLRGARGIEHALELRLIDGGGVFAQYVETGLQRGHRVAGVTVLAGADIERVDPAGEQRVETRADFAAEFTGESRGRFRAA